MKRSLFFRLTAGLLLLLFALSGCAAKEDSAAPDSAGYTQTAADDAYGGEEARNSDLKGTDGFVSSNTAAEAPNPSSTDMTADDLSEKIIYTATATVETLRFDQTMEDVNALVARFGGFLESSSVEGKSYSSEYYERSGYRTAQFTIRVPSSNYAAMKDSLSELGYVTDLNTSAQNITATYMDVESRLNTYEVEEERLLVMLEKAETVEDMITIETRLSEVRYQIESLTSTLRYYQTQVDYSTLYLTVSEVNEIVEDDPIPMTYGEELYQAAKDGLRYAVDTVKWIGKAVVLLFPILIVPAAIVVAVVIIVRARRKNRPPRVPGSPVAPVTFGDDDNRPKA